MLRITKASALMLIIAMIGCATLCLAQPSDNTESKGRWSRAVAIAKQRIQTNTEQDSPRENRTEKTKRQIISEPQNTEVSTEAFGWYQPKPKPEPIVGTWYINIPTSNGGLPPFNALQTFHDGGTFTESSDLLITQTEGPAFGVWSGKGWFYNLTFQLFVFDPENKVPVGMVRVRVAIRLLNQDELAGDTVVDFIAPDGTIELGIDGGPFTGKRIKVLSTQAGSDAAPSRN
ncbi:MAG TPA: hypothetical protein VEF04_15500 [Blastocatellia bacterium]|nr:hypothetical protein [Blastocatellia bacterium]